MYSEITYKFDMIKEDIDKQYILLYKKVRVIWMQIWSKKNAELQKWSENIF